MSKSRPQSGYYIDFYTSFSTYTLGQRLIGFNEGNFGLLSSLSRRSYFCPCLPGEDTELY